MRVHLGRERLVGGERRAPDVEIRAVGAAQEEAREDLALAEAGEEGRRAEKRSGAAEVGDDHLILRIGAVDEERHGAPGLDRRADPERGGHGGADVDRLDAEAGPQAQAHGLDVRVELRLADDGGCQRVAAQRHGAHLPVSDMPGHQEEAPAVPADPGQRRGVRLERRDLRDERVAPQPPDVDHGLAVLEEQATGQTARRGLRNAEREAEVLPDALERFTHESHGESVSDERDAVEDRKGQPTGAVVESAVDDAVRQSVGDPFPPAARCVLAVRRRAGFGRLGLPHRPDYIGRSRGSYGDRERSHLFRTLVRSPRRGAQERGARIATESLVFANHHAARGGDRTMTIRKEDGRGRGAREDVEGRCEAERGEAEASEFPRFRILWGENDRLIPVRHAREAHERIPGSRLEIFSDAGHFPWRDF